MDMQCQYRSKRCPNVRSVKISGELHRFCIFHRWRANATQRRWVQRKQTGDVEPTDSDASAGGSPTSSTPKRGHDAAFETPTIKTENEPTVPAPKRRRSTSTKKTSSMRAPTKPRVEVVAESEIPASELQPQPLSSSVTTQPSAPMGPVDAMIPPVSMTFPVLSEEDFVIFRHLVLEAEDHTHTAHKSPVAAADLGSCWWDANYQKHAKGQPSFMV